MLKTVSSITNAIGALNYKGTWNASTNTPALASGVGTKGDYYVVSVAGSTSLDGVNTWSIGDWVAFNGTAWQRVDGGVEGPAFSAYQSVAQTGLSSTVSYKVTFDTEEFDTNANFASSTFTPTVAGYYQVSGAFSTNLLDAAPSAVAIIYKNGSGFKNSGVGRGSPSNYVGAGVSALVYMNGTTDTLELYAYVDMNGVAGTYSTRAAQSATYFQASLVRSA